MSSKFAEMTLSAFCDYCAANPGGARKAYDLRKKHGGDMGGGTQQTVYRDRVVEKTVRVPVEVIKEIRVPVEVVKQVTVEKVVRKSPKPYLIASGIFFSLWMLVTLAWHVKDVNPVVEVPVEVEKIVEVTKRVEVPYEVVREVKVPDRSKELGMRSIIDLQTSEIAGLNNSLQHERSQNSAINRELVEQSQIIQQQDQEIYRLRNQRPSNQTGRFIGGIINEIIR